MHLLWQDIVIFQLTHIADLAKTLNPKLIFDPNRRQHATTYSMSGLQYELGKFRTFNGRKNMSDQILRFFSLVLFVGHVVWGSNSHTQNVCAQPTTVKWFRSISKCAMLQ